MAFDNKFYMTAAYVPHAGDILMWSGHQAYIGAVSQQVVANNPNAGLRTNAILGRQCLTRSPYRFYAGSAVAVGDCR